MTRGVDVTRILFFWITCFQAKGQKETLIVEEYTSGVLLLLLAF
jgi:hypothetical protein